MRRLFYLATVITAFSAQAFAMSADQSQRAIAFGVSDGADLFQAADERPDMSFKGRKSDEASRKYEKTVEGQLRPEQWKSIVVAVKRGNVTPFDLAEIRRRSEHENAEAIELLAWMYATGTGIRRDLPKSYAYYMHAAQLGVPSAYDNVRVVYQAMSPSQRESLPVY